jgi:hypothetical protein
MATEDERNLFSTTFTICATVLCFFIVVGLVLSEKNYHTKEIEFAKAGLEQKIEENRLIWVRPPTPEPRKKLNEKPVLQTNKSRRKE